MHEPFIKTGKYRVISSGTIITLEQGDIQISLTYSYGKGNESNYLLEFHFVDDGNMGVTHDIVTIKPSDIVDSEKYANQKLLITLHGFDPQMGSGNQKAINFATVGNSQLLINFTARQHPKQTEKILDYTIYAYDKGT